MKKIFILYNLIFLLSFLILASLISAQLHAQVVSTLAGSGSSGSTNATGTSASFNKPQGVVVDANGNVYVSEYSGNKIRKITPEGVVTTFAGSSSSGTSNGTGTAARFSRPNGLAIDASGNIYVAEYQRMTMHDLLFLYNHHTITQHLVFSTFCSKNIIQRSIS